MIYCADKVVVVNILRSSLSFPSLSGDVESTEPTKMLMRIAEHIDTAAHSDLKEWFTNNRDDILSMLADEKAKKSSKKQDSTQTAKGFGFLFVIMLGSFICLVCTLKV